jgi:hypothetical protein
MTMVQCYMQPGSSIPHAGWAASAGWAAGWLYWPCWSGIDETIKCDNTKRINLNFSNYLNPSNMNNSGFGNVKIYKNLYP